MTEQSEKQPAPFDMVALLKDLPEERLVRGQVGTVVDVLDGTALLVEFADHKGRAYAIVPCPHSALLVLYHEQQPA